MALSSGSKLGPYEILALIGAGGMGEVYRARDPRLGRDVAIKVSAEQFNERFEREARAVALLNHPNICHLYDVGPNYLVMEYIDGSPIAAPDTPRKLLDLAVQIADGMAAAHSVPLVHRDLKPDNILVTGAQSANPGRVKILDFGLAKIGAAAPAQADATRTMSLTDPGTTVGTVAYMSPEQARGVTDLTVQSDQFSFGLVLYELAAGRRAFVRGSAAETMTAIIREEPEPLPPAIPEQLRWTVERLLAKDPGERYDSTRDLHRELLQIRERLSQMSSSARQAATPEAPKGRARWAWLIAAAAIILSTFTVLLTPSARPNLSSYRFTPISREEGAERSPEWSPDGKSIAYTVNVNGIDQVFAKAIGAPDAAQLTRAGRNCESPLWSADGSTVYYSSGGNLWAVSASGGAPVLALEMASAATIHPNGKTIVFGRGGKAWVGELNGGDPREFWDAPHHQVSWRKFSPDGRAIALIESGDLWTVSYPAGESRKIGRLGVVQGASWMPDNRHLAIAELASGFIFTLSLLDVRDSSRRVVYAIPETILNPAVSPDGKRIAYATGAVEWDVVELSLPDGSVHTLLAGGGISFWPDWAPSGTHFLVSTNRSGVSAIEDVSSAERFSRQVAALPEGAVMVGAPRWAPDSARFAFNSFTSSGAALMISNASGAGQIVVDPQVGGYGVSWSPDGQWITYLKTDQQLAKIKPGPGSTPTILSNAAPAARGYDVVQWSPSGDWILYPVVDGVALISADGKTTRHLTSRRLIAYSFSKDGARVFGVFRNTTGQGAQWQLYSIEVASGIEQLLAPLDLPPSTERMAGFSLRVDGRRFLTSIAKWPYDIWMLEGFDQAPQSTWLDRLLRR